MFCAHKKGLIFSRKGRSLHSNKRHDCVCASQQLDTMEQLEEELTCPICCSLFEDPRVLLCSHSFCKKCLEGLLEGNRGPILRSPFKCPTCRKETPQNGANSLQINYSLRGIVEKYSRIRVAPKMCVCKHHSGQPLNIFCATDLKLICGFCATTDDHRQHRFCSLEDAYEHEKEAFEELLHGVESWQSAEILSCLETLQARKKTALQSVSKDAKKVTDYFDKLISSIDCKKSEILSDLETLKLVVMQAYDPEITKLSAALEEQRRAVAMSQSVRSISDPLLFLQQMQEFREKLRFIQETPLSSEKNLNVGPLVRNFDLKKWDSLRLREVDKISIPHDRVSYQVRSSRMTTHRWIALFLSLFLAAVLLVPAHGAAASAHLHIQPFIATVSTHLTNPGLFLREIAEMNTSLIHMCQECIQYSIECAVNFLVSCFN